MRNTFRHITAIVAIALLGSTAMTSWAQKTYTDEEKAAIKTKKQVIDNGDGSYQLKLETFVTGESSNLYQKTTTAKPMDIVLVLDVSGSMKTADMSAPADTTARNSQAYTYNGYNNSNYLYLHTDGNYYDVSRTTSTSGYNYTVHTEWWNENVEYSYNGYTNTYYYLHSDGNYYEVKRDTAKGGRNNNTTYYLLYYTVGSTKYYLSGTSTQTKQPTTPTRGNSTIWTGKLYERSPQTIYCLTYTVGSTQYYLSGTSVSTSISGATGNNQTIWTGVLYQANAGASITRLAALQNAVYNFIDSIAVKSDDANPHKLAIVKFASNKRNTVGNETNSSGYNYSQVIKSLDNLTSATAGGYKTEVGRLTASGATQADYGMEHAVSLLPKIDTTERKALVIMFTDGVPTDNRDWNNTVANGAISSSKTLKDAGAIVYTVGTFDSNTQTNQINNYMNYVSSNYPKASSMSSYGTKVASDYFILANDANKINEAFASITSEIPNGSTGGQGIDLDVEGENAVHLADIVTPSFKVPQGNSSVTLKMQFLDTLDLYHFADTSAFVWRDEVDVPEEVKVSVIENAADTTSTIDITGFDFSTNWVGPIFKKTVNNNDTTTVYAESTVKHGAKLVIYVDIIPNPDAVGGLVPTNTNKSGVYVGGVQITNDKLQDYITPEPVFTPMDLKIEIEGLGENENAIFNVVVDSLGREGKEIKGVNLGKNGMNIILTSTTEGSVASATIAKVPLNYTDGTPITYKVTLDEKWIWAYTAVEATNAPAGDRNYKTGYTEKEHALYEAEVDAEGKITNYTTNHIFKFKVAPVPGVSGHGENFKNNEFKIMPKAAATE